MNARSEAVTKVGNRDAPLDLEAIFRLRYCRIARVIARVIRDPGRSEELAVEVFLKWSRNPKAQGSRADGWLYRTAVRMGLDELRRASRRSRYGFLLGIIGGPPTPEQIRSDREDQERVRSVLGTLKRRQAGLLVLRSEGLSYDELASALGLNPASVGTLLSRAQHAFRREYTRRYGNP